MIPKDKQGKKMPTAAVSKALRNKKAMQQHEAAESPEYEATEEAVMRKAGYRKGAM